MRRCPCWVFAGLVIVLSCSSDGTSPDDSRAGLALAIALAADVQMAPDAGIVHVEGATNRTVAIQPGQTVTIEGLVPGNYTVALEGLRAGQLESFGETTVTVVAGQNRQANITLRSFVPAAITAPPQIEAGQPFTVQWTPVQGATGYIIEYADNPSFNGAQAVNATGTTASVTINAPGAYVFRARARNRFNTLSHASEPSAGTEVRTPLSPPVVTAYTVTLHSGVACGVGFRDLETVEAVAYTDADGNFPTGSPLAEAAAQAAVQSEYRFEGETAWKSFYTAKAWTHQQGATGAAGTIRSGACWRLPDTDPTYMDHRVRLRDADGNWGEFQTTRVMLPATISIQPSQQVTLAPGGSQQFSAVVRDADNVEIPGDVVAWSSANRPAMGSIDGEGRYTVAQGASGVDVVYGWAGRARALGFIQGPAAGSGGSWWAPCWNLNNFGLNQGAFFYYGMVVYADLEYRFALTGSQNPVGDADLYIRLGTLPTASNYDAESRNASFEESITWRAPATGVLWIGIHAATSFSGVGFSAVTTDEQCGFPGAALLPEPPPIATGASAPPSRVGLAR